MLTVWSGTVPDKDSNALTVASRTDTRYDARRNPYLEFVSEPDGTAPCSAAGSTFAAAWSARRGG